MKTYKNSFDKPHPELTLAETLRAELAPDEKIWWQGAPDPKYLSGSVIIPLLAAFPFSSVPVLMVYMFVKEIRNPDLTTDTRIVGIVGSVLFFVAFSFVSALLWVGSVCNITAHKRVVYAVTDRRALIVRKPVRNITVDSYYPNEIRKLGIPTGVKEVGDIRFYSDGMNHSPTTFPGFMNIRNLREVERLLRAMIAQNNVNRHHSKRESDTHAQHVANDENLGAELEPGETILWQGVPEPKFFNGRVTVPLLAAFPFSAVPFVIAYQAVTEMRGSDWTIGSAVQNTGSSLLAFCFFSFASVLLWMMAVLNINAHKRVAYAVTDRRAIVVRRTFKKTDVDSYFPHDILELGRNERKKGTETVGDIAFYRDYAQHSALTFPGFMNIRNPREVERILKTMISENTK